VQEDDIAEAATLADLTGATISANKPVAAFGGSGATTVADTASGGDHIEVQLIPTAAWGTSYECEKYTKRSPIDVDRWRIIGGVNGTSVTLSDPTIATIPTLAAGQVFEFATALSFDLTASEPVLVAHYLEAWGNLVGSEYDAGTFPRSTTNTCPHAGTASGTCIAPETCGGGGTPSQCGSGCAPETCAALGIHCGPASDGCCACFSAERASRLPRAEARGPPTSAGRRAGRIELRVVLASGRISA
jgi:hypothetical protein